MKDQSDSGLVFFSSNCKLTSLEKELEDASHFLRVQIWNWRMQDTSYEYVFGIGGCKMLFIQILL